MPKAISPRPTVAAALALTACGGPGPAQLEAACEPARQQSAFLTAYGEPHALPRLRQLPQLNSGAEGEPPLYGLYFAEDPPLPDDAGRVGLTEGSQQRLAAPAGNGLTLFLNREGGVYVEGASNSRENASPIVPCGVAELAPYAGDEIAWQAIMRCVKDQLAPFDVKVTDEEPRSGRYIEAVIGDYPETLGLPGGVGGIAPMDTYRCRVIDEAVVFVFSGRMREENIQRICEVTAQEAGHALGLDHVFLCEDPMSYLAGCGEKSFQNVAARCGEHAARDCACGRARQNSVAVLAEQVGMKGGGPPPPPVIDTEPPVIRNVAPVAGARVRGEGGVEVTAEVQDDVSVSRVELLWTDDDGERVLKCPGTRSGGGCWRDGARYRFHIDARVGEASFRVLAQDAVGRLVITPPRELVVEAGAPRG